MPFLWIFILLLGFFLTIFKYMLLILNQPASLSLHFDRCYLWAWSSVLTFFWVLKLQFSYYLTHIFTFSPTATVLPSLLIVYFNIWSCFSFKRLYIIWLSCEWLVFLGFLRCEFNELIEYLYSFIIFQMFLATHGSSDSMRFGKHGISTVFMDYI